jgi:hypothetical protein
MDEHKSLFVPIHWTDTTALFQTRVALGASVVVQGQYDVAPDGRFLINVALEDTVNSSITILQNWKPPSQ